MVQYKIKSGSNIEEGKHEGEIVALDENERGEKKYKYIDIIIRLKDSEQELKYGCPAPKETLNPKSKIGKLLDKFVSLEEDATIDPEDVLIGKKISFMTQDKNGFANIVEDSIKPNKQ